MAFKLVILAAALAVANAGFLPAAPALAYSAAPAVSSFSYSSPVVSYGTPIGAHYAAPIGAQYAAPLGAQYATPIGAQYAAPIGAQYAAPIGAQYAAPAISSQSSNVLRSFGNLGQVSTFSKTIDTPFSSVSKSDVRVSNPGLRFAAAPVAAYAAAPAIHAAPIATYSAGPALHAAPGAIGVAYSAAPAVSHVSYTGLGASYYF